MDVALRSSLLTRTDAELSRLGPGRTSPRARISADESALYIRLYPFLDRDEFQEKAFHLELPAMLEKDPQYSALYHAVLAPGCQQYGRGSFDPGKGRAWELFRVSLSHTADVLNFGDSLAGVQTSSVNCEDNELTMLRSIFSMNACYLQVERSILAEATRMTLALRYHKSATEGSHAICRRVFWVIYHLEKQYSFQARRSSSIADYDVGCPIPNVPDSTFGDYNWFLFSIRFSRILSIAYESLFSVTASTRDKASLLTAIGRIRGMLDQWRQSIPQDFRPKEPLNRHRLADPHSKQAALSTQCYYFHLVIALERMSLQLEEKGGLRQQDSRKELLQAARTIIELTRFIDVEPYTPIFTLAIMPLSALFILFDFIIYNPYHPDVRSNITLLEVATGHFSLLDHASDGSLPGSHLSEFAHIARRYIQELPARSSETPPQSGSNRSGDSYAHNDVTGQTEGNSSLPEEDTGGYHEVRVDSMDAYEGPEVLNYPMPDMCLVSTEMQPMSDVDFRALFNPTSPDPGQLYEYH
ncbi:putative transcriptional regulatory protein C530.05-like protein 10 [Colletotrichum chlorophyti]|uniref:Putative transcriptional regulatory protein C530.05-like protein 10 n=1 Tax=Colletotrichum chlorophyti TaxID=708187 RepID=A0A1Q8RWK9_9PEZI|nr:putative transcriptional regulatory protein C530.05-like protein 10 [Colletotrichum chlorophyti]